MQAGCLPGRRTPRRPGLSAPPGGTPSPWTARSSRPRARPARGRGRGRWLPGSPTPRRGAVLAAVNIAVRTSGQLGPAIFTATITRQVTGPGAQALLAGAWQDYAQASGQHPPATPGGPAGAADASPRAFRLLSWTPAAADVEVLAAADGRGAVIGLQVRWQGGDWRLLAPPGGNFAASAARTADLSAFTLLPGS